jgi:hexosaminidase
MLAAGAAVMTVALASASSSAGTQQDFCHPDATDLLVTYQPVDHEVGSSAYYRAQLTLENRAADCELGPG